MIKEETKNKTRNKNKVLKAIVIALAVVIVGTGAAIPLFAAVQENQEMQAVPEGPAAPAGDAVTAPEGPGAEDPQLQITTIQMDAQTKGNKSMAAAIVVGLAAAAGAIGMALAISKAVEGTARQPEAGGKIQTMLMLGLVFIETAIIYALIVAILIIFVL